MHLGDYELAGNHFREVGCCSCHRCCSRCCQTSLVLLLLLAAFVVVIVVDMAANVVYSTVACATVNLCSSTQSIDDEWVRVGRPLLFRAYSLNGPAVKIAAVLLSSCSPF